jgi:hypothetical protein
LSILLMTTLSTHVMLDLFQQIAQFVVGHAADKKFIVRRSADFPQTSRRCHHPLQLLRRISLNINSRSRRLRLQFSFGFCGNGEFQNHDWIIHPEIIVSTKSPNLPHLGLRNEAKQKFTKFTPRSLGQALRISGITPADVTVLAIHLGRN